MLVDWIEQEMDAMRSYRMEVGTGNEDRIPEYEHRCMAFLQLVLKLVC